jgi:protease-4
MEGKIKITILIIISLFVLSWLVASLFDGSSFGNVAHIKINGAIMAEKGGFFDSGVASSSEIVSFIEKADTDSSIKAILLEINSPGGAPVASAEIAEAVKKSSKPVVALIRDSGTSGAYWVASSAYKIVAHPLSVTGSIGVYGSYLQYSGLLDRFNITYERMVGGKYKDIGSQFKPLTDDERESLQNTIDLMHEYFIQSVAENRNMSLEDMRKLADGNFYLGIEAKKLGLIDFLGGKEVAEEVIKQRLNTTEISYVEYKTKTSIFDVFGGMMSNAGFSFGKGFANGVMEKELPIKT